MVAYQKSYEKQTPCGGWIPWRICTQTYYKEEYHPVTVLETVNLTDCCNGYEQVGLYCSLSLNRSSEFASRLGACPTKEVEGLNLSCSFDMDCPENKKCCETTKGMVCADPVPEEQTVTKYWFSMSVLVKMDFNELIRVDPSLLKHSRLLHSMITGALWPLNVSVYHIKTTQAETYPETLASKVLVGLHQLVSLENITSLLKDIVMRVYEVVDIVVQDADPGLPNILMNSKSSSQKTSRSVDSECYSPAIRNHRIFKVTSSSFEVSWSVNSMQNHSFQVEVYKGKILIQGTINTDMKLDVSNLEAGVMYTVKISYEVCDKTVSSYRNVKTDALIFALTIRILNYNFTDQFLNSSSADYQAFSNILMAEIRNSLPSNMSALYKMDKLKIQMDSFKAGSIIARLKIIIDDPEFPKNVSAFDPMMSSLYKSVVLLVDSNSSAVEDWNECASRAENDCCMFAECINTIGSYACRCKTTTDDNPLRPGRNCEGDLDPGLPNDQLQYRNSSVSLMNSTSVSHKNGGSVDSECYPPAIRNHKIFNVTSSSFEVSWSVNSTQNHSFQVEVYKGKELIQGTKTTDTKLDVSNLESGVMYTVKISYEVGDKNVSSYRNVKTDALIFALIMRILNYNFTDQFLNTSSTEYQAFSSVLLTEIRNSLPSNMSALYKIGKLKVQMDTVKAGSIIVKLKIIIDDPEFPKDVSAFDSLMSSLYKSVVLLVDSNSSAVKDWNECASRTENDCCTFAECINTIGSYMCRCKTTTDANPLRPGRNCEGEIVDPVTDIVPTLEANVTEGLPVTSAPSLSMAEIRAVTSFTSKSTEAIILPSRGSQESSTLATGKTLSASQRRSTFGHDWNNNTLRTSEIVALVTEIWNNATTSNGNLSEERLAAQEQHNASLSKVSNTTVYPFLRNGSVEETSTSGLLTDRKSQEDPALNVTQHSKGHALNQTLDKEMGGNNRSWSEGKSSTMLPSSSEQQTIASLATDCGGESVFTPEHSLKVIVTFPAEGIVFSNVTSTSFQVRWMINVTVTPAFQFLLLEGKQLIQEIKTQSSNLTISRLEPGILYTVEITTEVCGNQSKPVQRKVMTAAQKFNGTVRILNLNYSSELSNSSSEEYRNFSQLFLNEVCTSLPLNILQKMNASMIKMLIMSITNGSIVVRFSLLTPANLDASNVSRSFLDAFQHSRHFRIDNSSLSIGDYDECQREETDCSPNASCYNTYGSYECHCKEGFINVNAERPGRNCEVLLSNHNAGGNQTKAQSSTVLPLTATNTTDNKVFTGLIVNIPSSPQVSSQSVVIKEAVQVLCEFEKIVIAIQKAFLQKGSIPESSLYLGSPQCRGRNGNSSHVILQAGWNECGTEVQSNTTHTIVKTILRNKPSPGVIHYFRIASPISCVFQNDLLTSSGYSPEGVYTVFEDLQGSGHFLTRMQLFIGNSPIPQNFSISASDDIKIEVGIQTRDRKLKVVVSQCWATPTNNSMDPLSFPFILGSCPVPNSHTTMIANGMSSKAQFKLKIFSFVNDTVVYLHCKIHVCVESHGTSCRTTCSGFRFQRAGETIAMPRASWGPLRKFNDDVKEEKKSGLGIGYIVLIVIGVFVFALGIAGLLVFRHQRKSGAYNFKIKSDNFNYQVFYD
ncbi:uromodulin-like 1 [Elgaria multicarinata webbii]|uniref:uromodulin-like 1 n=1 Tax=Elgaria multicarinata webbii TaxID=159646 RepID=UPI002FCCFEEB